MANKPEKTPRKLQDLHELSDSIDGVIDTLDALADDYPFSQEELNDIEDVRHSALRLAHECEAILEEKG